MLVAMSDNRLQHEALAAQADAGWIVGPLQDDGSYVLTKGDVTIYIRADGSYRHD